MRACALFISYAIYLFLGTYIAIAIIKLHRISLSASHILVYYVMLKKQPGCKKVRGQSEATIVRSDQKF